MHNPMAFRSRQNMINLFLHDQKVKGCDHLLWHDQKVKGCDHFIYFGMIKRSKVVNTFLHGQKVKGHQQYKKWHRSRQNMIGAIFILLMTFHLLTMQKKVFDLLIMPK